MTSQISEQQRQFDAFKQLSAPQQAVLNQLAVTGPLSKTALSQIINDICDLKPHITQPEMNALLQELQQQGWLENTEARWQLSSTHANGVVLALLDDGDEFDFAMEYSATLDSKTANLFRTILWKLCLVGADARLLDCYMQWKNGKDFRPEQHPLLPLVIDDAGREVFARFKPEVQEFLLVTALNEANFHLSECEALWLFAKEYADAVPNIQPEMALQALWRDDQAWLKKYQSADLSTCMVGWLELYEEDHDGALKTYQQFASHMRKISGKRRPIYPPAMSMMAAIFLLSRSEPQHLKTLHEIRGQARLDGLSVEWMLLRGLFEEAYRTKLHLSRINYLDRPLSGMPGIFQALILFWLGETPNLEAHRQRLRTFASKLESRGYVLAAYEMRTLLQLQFNEAAPLELRNRYSLSHVWQPKVNWEYALEALNQLAPNSADNASRLAWMLTQYNQHIEMVPLEQKRNSQGWTKGRSISLKRLRYENDKLPWLNAQDLKIVNHIVARRSHSYYGSDSYDVDVDKALPLLAGHPAVFWQHSPDIRIDVEAGQIGLLITESDNHLSLKLSPELGYSQHVVIVNETPTRIVAYPITEAHLKIGKIIGDELRIPVAARERVLQSVASIAPLLPVQANLPELMAHIPHIEPDEKIYAQLLPQGEGLRAQLLVHPLANGAWMAPGRGNEIVKGEQNGQAVQARRNLSSEKEKLRNVIRSCPLLAENEQDNAEWQFDNVQDALEALTELRAIDSELLECVWPEGERYRVGSRRNMRSLTLNVKRQGEWFALDGELALDNGKVIELRQLLKLMNESQGRFIRLDEQEWLALDHQLRQRLQQITLLTGQQDGNLTLNTLTLPFIKELADEAGDLVGDADWQQKLRELEKREQHQPQLPGTLKAELRDYQLEGFQWLSRLAQWGVGACLADDMGLGKTLQSLALLLERAPAGPQLVIAPTSVTHNWLSESARFAPTLQMRDYRSQRELTDLSEFDVVVVSYGILQQEIAAFTEQHWHSVVLDEAQTIKNAQTQRARAVTSLKADFRLALSGTPVENNLGDLWSLFRFINPGLLGSQKVFNQRFAAPIAQGSKVTSMTLKQLIKPFMLRRTKAQVLQELPARTDIVHVIPMSDEEQHWYEALRQQAVERLEENAEEVGTIQVLAELTRLRRFCCNPALVLPELSLTSSKLTACLDIISELRANNHSALIFSQFVDHLALLRQALDQQNISYQYLDGSTSPAERKKRVTSFQSGDGDLFLISLKAGGTGLNLTAADYVIHLDPWWNPAVEDQASDRAHRIGQKRPVTVYRLVMEASIEEQIVALHNKKRQLADDLLEGSDSVGKLNAEALLSVLRGK